MTDNNITHTKEIIEQLDINFFPQVQSLLNKLYESEEGNFYSQLFFNIPLANIITAFISLFFFFF